MSKLNIPELQAKLPTEKNDAEQKKKRMELFTRFDPNGNGYLSLAECDKGIKDVLQLDGVFECKPAIMRAFQAARDVDKRSGSDEHRDNYVQRSEFRLFLVYLLQYFELYVMFDLIDSGDDRRVNLDEFKAALPKLDKWGVKVDNAEEEFKTVDKNGGGEILFDEFCAWALSKNLDMDKDDK
eukprot:CAMPEP_0201522276 /NCGR_PEP_ID=MMETSP0161_2-20130828/16690_1 /ASSEMBLY_ACC=CAM_ASM_000251 /TAXON_ID=180227 /ORGANISM="Neoparamoeba aestuarina, Strain SoJaBio B1-5/56/2" /LENGTH=181 /DNA_ID=CAMNT_0047921067 /DNA_START=126 /DNA_END=669 /DNA_ORIENTATION=-